MVAAEDVREVLKGVYDPEINLDIITLELIYDVKVEGGTVDIKMTFTTPFCPYGPALVDDIKRKVKTVEGVKNVNVEVVFDPPWKPSDDLKNALGIV